MVPSGKCAGHLSCLHLSDPIFWPLCLWDDFFAIGSTIEWGIKSGIFGIMLPRLLIYEKLFQTWPGPLLLLALELMIREIFGQRQGWSLSSESVFFGDRCKHLLCDWENLNTSSLSWSWNPYGATKRPLLLYNWNSGSKFPPFLNSFGKKFLL